MTLVLGAIRDGNFAATKPSGELEHLTSKGTCGVILGEVIDYPKNDIDLDVTDRARLGGNGCNGRCVNYFKVLCHAGTLAEVA